MFKRILAALAAVEIVAIWFGMLAAMLNFPFWEGHNGTWLCAGWLALTGAMLALVIVLIGAVGE